MPGPMPNIEKRAHLTNGGKVKAHARLSTFQLSLPDDALRVYGFIKCRTLRFGNFIEEISIADFLEGARRGGQYIAYPVGISADRVLAAIDTLIAREAIRVREVQGVTYYELNLEWSVPGFRPMPPIQEWDYDYSQGVGE